MGERKNQRIQKPNPSVRTREKPNQEEQNKQQHLVQQLLTQSLLNA